MLPGRTGVKGCQSINKSSQGYGGERYSVTSRRSRPTVMATSRSCSANGGADFTIYGPNGQLQEDGGGSYFMINPIDGSQRRITRHLTLQRFHASGTGLGNELGSNRKSGSRFQPQNGH